MAKEMIEREILHWNYRNLQILPEETYSYGKAVRELYLKRNCILKLPGGIKKLENLTKLFLNGNLLSTLPSDFGELKTLRVLDLSLNRLEFLPSTIGFLSQLEELVLTQNQITLLPKELRNLKRLKYLEASDNRLNHIEEEVIEGFECLEELGVDLNPLKFLPRNLHLLKNLKSLSACKCDLHFLPAIPFGTQTSSVENPSQLTFRFDGNMNLSYVPLWIFLNPSFETFGIKPKVENLSIKTEDKAEEFPYIFVELTKNHYKLWFDDLRNTKCKSISLLELNLRALYAQKCSLLFKGDEPEVPKNLLKILQKGPLALCHSCEKGMFTETYILLFTLPHISRDERRDGNEYYDLETLGYARLDGISFGVAYFCSSRCFDKEKEKENLKYIFHNFIKYR